jgi:hypothetical protein
LEGGNVDANIGTVLLILSVWVLFMSLYAYAEARRISESSEEEEQ